MSTAGMLHQAYHHSLDAVQTGIRTLYQPGTAAGPAFSNPPEVKPEWSNMNSGVDHLRLDDHFLRNSQSWRAHFPEKDIQHHQTGSVDALHKSGKFLNEYGNTMNSQAMSNLRDNEVRENHQWAINNLRGLRGELQPYTATSHDRVQQFCDWVGVTDRYTGYRNNLSRPKKSVTYEPAWRRNDQRVPPQVTFASETTPPRQVQRFNISASNDKPLRSLARPATAAAVLSPSQNRASIQEQYGVISKFPGVSETKERLPRPATALATTYDYKINPKPDYSVVGGLERNQEIPSKGTEYGSRYMWPDGKQNGPLPWHRK